MNNHQSPSKILVVEGQPKIRAAIRSLLGQIGIDPIEEADNGQTALEMATATPFDLIVSGIQLPRIDGLSMIRQLRRNLTIKDVPVLLVSSNYGDYLSRHARRINASGFVDRDAADSGRQLQSEVQRILFQRTPTTPTQPA